MHTTLEVAPASTAIHYNGRSNTAASGLVLHNGLPMPILPQAQVSPHTRHLMIETAAFFIAQGRGFLPGHELDDWLAAERMIGADLSRSII